MNFNKIKVKKLIGGFEQDYTFYQFSFFQENNDLLNEFFTAISTDFKKLTENLYLFYLSDKKDTFENTQFYSIWNDHPYPDKIVICWSGLDTTKNNLGRVITISYFSSTTTPYILYSFTKDRLYIVEELFREYKEEGVPRIIEFTIPEFLKLLDILYKNIDKMNELGLDECEIESFEV